MIGGGIALAIVGLVLALAFNTSDIGPLNVGMLGWILVVGGVILTGVGFVLRNNPAKSRHITSQVEHAQVGQPTERVVETPVAGERVVGERVVENPQHVVTEREDTF